MPKKTGRGGDYEVGYGKPPVATRFRKGQSGNPKGRPRPTFNPAEMLEQAMIRTVTTREGDVIRRVPAMQAMCLNLVTKAINGDLRAIAFVTKYAKELNIPFKDVNRSIMVKYVTPSHFDGAWIPEEVTDEDFAYVLKLRECSTREERRVLARNRKILLAERNSPARRRRRSE